MIFKAWCLQTWVPSWLYLALTVGPPPAMVSAELGKAVPTSQGSWEDELDGG